MATQQVSLDVVANSRVKEGFAEVIADTENFTAEFGRELEARAAPAGQAIEGVTAKLQAFVKEERRKGEMGSFFAQQLREIIPASNEATRAIGGVLGAFAMGGGIGIGIELVTVGVGALVRHFMDAQDEADKLEQKRFDNLRKQVEGAAQAVEDYRVKLKAAQEGKDVEQVTREEQREAAQQLYDKLLAERKAIDARLAELTDTKNMDRGGAGNAIVALALDAKRLDEELKKAKATLDQFVAAEKATTADRAREAGKKRAQEAERDREELEREHQESERQLEQHEQRMAALRAKWAKRAADERAKIWIEANEDLEQTEKEDAETRLAIIEGLNRELERLDEETARRRIELEKKVAAARLKEAEEAALSEMEASQEAWVAEHEAHNEMVEEQKAEVAAYSSYVRSSVGLLVSNILDSHATMGERLKSVWQGLVNIIGNALTTLLTKAITNALADQAVTTATATTKVAANAAVAGSATAAQTATIPWVGPAVAVAAGLAMMAAILGAFAITSSEGGYVVPSHISEQLAFIHRDETVLPAPLSIGLRDAIEGGSLGGRQVNVTIQAWDGADVRRVVASPDFWAGMREAERNGWNRG